MPLYTWFPKDQKNWSICRPTNKTYNWISAIWGKKIFTALKTGNTNSEIFCNYFKLLNDELKLTLSEDTYNNKMVVFMDNARIHKAGVAQEMINIMKLKVFTLVPYTPEQNRIEHLFGYVKAKLSRMNHCAKSLDYF